MLTPFLSSKRKLRIVRPTVWEHHRGGWKHVIQHVREHLHCEDGIRFVSAVEEIVEQGEVISEPWVGFIHEVPHHRYRFPDLRRLLRIDTWKASIRHCRGLWTLSTNIRDYLRDAGVPVPISRVPYPVEVPEHIFSFEDFSRSTPRKVLFIGQYLRNFQCFFDLAAPGYEKLLLRSAFFDRHEADRPPGDSVRIVSPVADSEYDKLLTESIVFLNLFDAGGNTTVIECLARTTPVLVNRLDSLVEYLGESYPFFYDDLAEAEQKLGDMNAIASTVLYMRRFQGRRRITFDHFLTAIQNTALYRSLPLPASQQREFRAFDVTVLICSYKRVDGLGALLERFIRQDFPGTFEIILWNNDASARERVQRIADEMAGKLAIKVIHSTENYYCIVRMAAASLMRSETLLVCDDDVLPNNNYISRFIGKQRQYGSEAVICARGHVFQPHQLDEECPEMVWGQQRFLEFHDESTEERPVHFMHADNCVIPKRVLQRIAAHDLPGYEVALVDDYWMSFVIGHELGIPIIKIKADDSFSFTPSAEDPSIALFHSAKVREARVDFYVHHMRRGWPVWDGQEGTSE